MKSGAVYGGGVYSGGGKGWMRQQQNECVHESVAIEGAAGIAGALDQLQPSGPHGGFAIRTSTPH